MRVAGAIRPAFFVSIVLSAIHGMLLVAPPLLIMNLVDEGIVPANSSEVVRWLVSLALLYVLTALVSTTEARVGRRLGVHVVQRIRNAVYRAARTVTLPEIRLLSTQAPGYLTVDAVNAQALITRVPAEIVSALVTASVGVIALMAMHEYLLVASVTGATLSVIASGAWAEKLARNEANATSEGSKLSTISSRLISYGGLVSVRAFCQSNTDIDLFDKSAAKVAAAREQLAFDQNSSKETSNLIYGLTVCSIYAVGALLVLQQKLTIGELLTAALLYSRLTRPIGSFSLILQLARKGISSSERIIPLLIKEEMATSRIHPPGSIESIVISKRCGSNIECIEIPKFGTTAIVGPNGKGKTTLCAAMVGLTELSWADVNAFDKNGERICIDNRNSEIAYCPPCDLIVDEAIHSEKLASSIETENLIEKSKADSPAKSMSLSSGQRQRLAFDITMDRKAKFSVLDEPFSHQDPEGIRSMVTAINSARSHRSIIIVSHQVPDGLAVDNVLDLELLMPGPSNGFK